jgi:hypothetical protein
MAKSDLDRLDGQDASLLAVEIVLHASLVALLAKTRDPRGIAEEIAKRAKRDAEAIRRQEGANAAIVLPMEIRVGDLIRNLAIAVSGMERKR